MIWFALGLVIGFVGGALFTRRNISKVNEVVSRTKSKMN